MKKSFIHLTAICLGLLLGLSLGSCQASDPGTDPTLEAKIDRLIKDMTLQEKAGQLNQLSGGGNNEHLTDAVQNGLVGSVLNVVDPDEVNRLQRLAMDSTGIPLLIGRDVIHGFKTIFPIPLGLAATFDTELVEETARVAATEATSVGVRWTFSPMLDIARDPRWGRIAEGSGEDPVLDAAMGAAMIRGYQGTDYALPTAMAACMKHFAGYGAAEGGRDYNSTNIPERLLRNVYLPAFEAAVNANVLTVMTSFNENDGVPATCNAFLLQQVLRDEWGFDGMVVTDWNSSGELIPHGVATDLKDATRLSLQAGVDMDMSSYGFVQHLPALVQEGKVKEADIDRAVRNILRLKFRLGLFDNPYVDPQLHTTTFYAPQHLATAQKAAQESAVLLKNDGTLPLDTTAVLTVLVTGPMAHAPHDQLGTWIFDGDAKGTITPLTALRQRAGQKIRLLYEPALDYSRQENPGGIARAVALARQADVVVAFVGEESFLSGEAHSLADLNLLGGQDDLIAQLSLIGKPLVTVVMAGRPLTIAPQVEQSNALLYAFHPGTMGGPALADLLLGRVAPSGKLPVTMPATVGQIPLYYNHNNTGRPYRGTEKKLSDLQGGGPQSSLGDTSFYLDAGAYPLFPFGYGLSYTTFAYTNIKIDQVQYAPTDQINVSFDLTNTGQMAGTEVAQLYVRDLVGSIARPVKELKKFVRVSLQPGETKNITITLPVQELAFWNLNMEKKVEAGDFQLWVASNSDSGQPLTFQVTE